MSKNNSNYYNLPSKITNFAFTEIILGPGDHRPMLFNCATYLFSDERVCVTENISKE